MIQAILFDFDGLILETEGPVYQSWQELYRAYGFELPFDSWATIIGTTEAGFDPQKRLEELVNDPLDWEAIEPRRRARELELVYAQRPRPGVETYLAEARRLGLKVGLASSSTCGWVTGHLERLGLLGYFDCLRASDDVSRTKPDPALYQAVLQALEVRAEQAIALEDSPNGILAAKRAGIFTVAVPNPLTRTLSLEHADLRLESLEEISLEELIAAANHRPG